MPVTFELIDVLIFIGICQGIFLALTLQRIVNTNQKANRILSALIVISTFMLVGRFLMIRYFSIWVFYVGLLFDVVIFLFGPLFYFYTKSFLSTQKSTKRVLLFHFIPAILFLGFVTVCYLKYTPETYMLAYQEGKLTIVFRMIIFIAVSLNMYYLIKSFQVLRLFKKETRRTLSFQQNPVQYMRFFLIAISVIIVLWAVSFINGFFDIGYLSFITYDLVWAAIPFFIYTIGYFSLKQPELFRVPMKTTSKSPKERLSADEIAFLQEKLNSLMRDDKLFLHSHLTLSDVAEKLQTSTNNVSWLLNKVYKTTFYDFINHFRIEEFVRKVENNEHLSHTILALSFDVGFNSKSTFNKAFKIHKHDTPSNFIKKHQAA